MGGRHWLFTRADYIRVNACTLALVHTHLHFEARLPACSALEHHINRMTESQNNLDQELQAAIDEDFEAPEENVLKDPISAIRHYFNLCGVDPHETVEYIDLIKTTCGCSLGSPLVLIRSGQCTRLFLALKDASVTRHAVLISVIVPRRTYRYGQINPNKP
eukprot:459889-Pyramimonas_sp.AAC.2